MKRVRKASKIKDIKQLRLFTHFLYRLGLNSNGGLGLASAKYLVERVWDYAPYDQQEPFVPSPQFEDMITKIKNVRRFMFTMERLGFRTVDPSLYWGKQFVDKRRNANHTR